MKEIFKESDFDSEILNQKCTVIAYFWSIKCKACDKAAKFLSKLEKAYSNKLKIVKLNIDYDMNLAIRFGISQLPTFMLFKENDMKLLIEGFKGDMKFERQVRPFIIS